MFEKDVQAVENNYNSKNEMVDLEFRRFLGLKVVDRTQDPMEWWATFGIANFPSLYTTAMKYLIIPASSVPSERVFSVAGEVLSKKRNSLSPESANMIITLHANMKK